MIISPICVQFKTAYELLDVNRESLCYIVRTDTTFPLSIETGDTKQALVYFDYADLVEWHKQQKSQHSAMEV